MRKAHVLSENRSKAKPRYFVFFDSEARVDPETLQHNSYLICAVFCDMRYQKEHWKDYLNNLSSFWEDVANFGEKRPVYVYAHNMGYDLIATGGIPVLVANGYTVTSFFEKGMTFILQASRYIEQKDKDGNNVRGKKKTVNLISSTNYYPQSLKQLGDIFGLPKLEFDCQYGTLEEAIPYCRRDVEICKMAVERFISFVTDENLGVLAKTTPGQAFNAYRHRFMTVPVYLHDNQEAVALERQAYSGGRVECWRLGKYTGAFYGYDINSMYPYVMRKYDYPVRLLTHRPRLSVPELQAFISNGACVIAECHIKVDRPYVGTKLEQNFLFPVGDFWTTLCTPEIAYLLAKGMIMEVGAFNLYEGANIFKDYVDYFYSRKVQAKTAGDNIHQNLYKLFLNSLYGKFGQLSEEFIRWGNADPTLVKTEEVWDADKKKMTTVKIFGGSVFLSQEQGESFNSFCAISAHITAYARMTLLHYIELAGWDNVLYMDTDSLFVTEEGSRNLIEAGAVDPNELGKMKLEKQSDMITINAPKDYVFAHETRRKGISKNALQINDNTWEVVHFPGLNTFIRQGQLSKFYNVKHIKKLTRQYAKGWLLDNGKVMPLELADNAILPWENTVYAEQGLVPWNIPEQEEIIRKKFKESFAGTEEKFTAQYQRQLVEEEAKKIRRLIREEGGIFDPDYEYLPRWAKRRAGRRLDELVLSLQEAGFPVNGADDVYNLIWQYA